MSNYLGGDSWVAVGDDANWERGFENGIWGLKPQIEHHWKRLKSGDLVLFYCKAPVKGFVGAGIIRSKFRQTEPYWKEELKDGRVIWPFRFEFDVTHLIPLAKWQQLAISNRPYNTAILAGISPIKNPSTALKVLEALQFTKVKAAHPEKEIAATVFEIGKIQRMIVESNVAVDGDYLDVVWKRTIRSVPTFAFSIKTGKDIEPSIRPLKHAFDLWNSRPFLITSESSVPETGIIIEGPYHEFSENLKILTVPQVNDLYASKKKYFDLEERYGLR